MEKTKKDKKTVGVMIRFFANALPDHVGIKNDLIPFWTRGNVHVLANKTKGIKPQNVIFNCFEDIPSAIKTVLSGAKLVAVEEMAHSMRVEKRRNKK